MTKKIILVIFLVIVSLILIFGAYNVVKYKSFEKIIKRADNKVVILDKGHGKTSIDLYSTGSGVFEKIYKTGGEKIIIIDTQFNNTTDFTRTPIEIYKYSQQSYYKWDIRKGISIEKCKKISRKELEKLVNEINAIEKQEYNYNSNNQIHVSIRGEEEYWVNINDLNIVLEQMGFNI